MISSFQRLFLACGRHGRHALSAILFLSAGGAAVAQNTCAFPGANGPGAAVSGVINSYHGGSGTAAAGASTLNVASATGLRSNTHQLVAGDLILVIQMQDSASGASAGFHEYAQVASIAGTAVTLTRPLTRTYTQLMNTANVQSWQVVWVPQLSSATISGAVTADRFTINTASGVVSGGIVALDVAGSLAINSSISVAGAGFRGAAGLNGTASFPAGTATTANSNFDPTSDATVYGGQKGEGSQGTPPRVFDGTATPVAYTTLLGQGYALGAGGQAAIGNAGGGANDGLPATGTNQYNSGGGGGANAGAGGQGGNSWNNGTAASAALNQNQTTLNIGNVAGGKGGNAVANSVTRLYMGGGGGAGSANNSSGASGVTVFPPTATATVDNGATGPISSSGAPGGGIVLIRAGTISGSGSISAAGYRAYNKSLSGTSATDSAGGGGGGGSIVLLSGNGAATTLNLDAAGGDGGSSDYYNHGPGGGGGGGFILTNFAVSTAVVTGGTNGQDACCSGTAGNGSPKAYNSAPGAIGGSATTGGTPSGLLSGAQCLPAITTTKSAVTPSISVATGATAQYTIRLANTGGAASNVYLLDAALPPGWTFSTGVAPTYVYSPAPPGAASAGAETTAAVIPAGFPVTAYTSANSNAAVSLRAAGAAPGVVPSAGNNTLTFGSFYLPQNGALTVTFTVSIPDTATVGTYHNPGGVLFLDPTRDATLRAVTPSTNSNANRTNTTYGGTTYFSGSTTAVAGANHSGLAAGPTTDDVRLLPDFSVTKSAPASVTAGSTFTYTITPRNNGRPIADQVFNTTQATDAAASALGSNPLTITDTLPTGVTTSTAFSGTGYSCSGGTTVTCTRSNANAYPIAAATDYPTITATMTLTAVCSPAPSPSSRVNTVTISVGAGETATANNTAVATTAIGCYSTNITITKTNSVTSLNSGASTVYTITVANTGATAVPAGTLVRDTASAGLSCSTVTCTSATPGLCPISPNTYANLNSGLALGAFPAGASAAFNVSCSVTATGS